MCDLTLTLAGMRRPGLLLRAARMAALTRNARRRGARRPAGVLLAEEAALNDARLSGDPGYSATRHVEVMSAILCVALTAR